MHSADIPLKSWIRFAVICGFAAMVSYSLAIFAPLPEKASLILAFAFGPFFMLGSLGLYRIGQFWKNSLSLQVGALFNIVGTAFATMMLVVQQTVFSFHDQFKNADRGTVTAEQLKWIFREVNSVQLGMDLAWDVFISAGTFCLALGYWGHPVMGKVIPAIGMLVGVLLLGFNMASFPVPPGEAGSIDFGPLVALWYLVVTIWILIKRKKLLDAASA